MFYLYNLVHINSKGSGLCGLPNVQSSLRTKICLNLHICSTSEASFYSFRSLNRCIFWHAFWLASTRGGWCTLCIQYSPWSCQEETSHGLAKRRHLRLLWTLAHQGLAEELWANIVWSDGCRFLSVHNCTTLEPALCLHSKMLLGVNWCVLGTWKHHRTTVRVKQEFFSLFSSKDKLQVIQDLAQRNPFHFFFWIFKFIQMHLIVGFMLATIIITVGFFSSNHRFAIYHTSISIHFLQ